MNRKRPRDLGIAALLTVAAVFIMTGCGSHSGPPAPGATASKGGQDSGQRIDIKRGKDPDASQINLTPKDITVEDLLAEQIPADMKGDLQDYGDKRIGDFEKSTFRLTGTLKSVIKRKDGDYFLVVAGKSGRTAVVEVPDPDLTKGSALQSQIEATRQSIEDKYHPTDKRKDINQPVTIDGVGFYGTQGKAGASGGNRPPRLMPGTGFKAGK